MKTKIEIKSVIGTVLFEYEQENNTLKETLDLSLLNSIIIPEDYKEGLFDFQKLNGHTAFITENEYGRGVAQVVSSKNESGETVNQSAREYEANVV